MAITNAGLSGTASNHQTPFGSNAPSGKPAQFTPDRVSPEVKLPTPAETARKIEDRHFCDGRHIARDAKVQTCPH